MIFALLLSYHLANSLYKKEFDEIIIADFRIM